MIFFLFILVSQIFPSPSDAWRPWGHDQAISMWLLGTPGLLKKNKTQISLLLIRDN